MRCEERLQYVLCVKSLFFFRLYVVSLRIGKPLQGCLQSISSHSFKVPLLHNSCNFSICFYHYFVCINQVDLYLRFFSIPLDSVRLQLNHYHGSPGNRRKDLTRDETKKFLSQLEYFSLSESKNTKKRESRRR